MKAITKPQEKISCKPTASQNLAGMPTLHLLEAARSRLCASAGAELKPLPPRRAKLARNTSHHMAAPTTCHKEDVISPRSQHHLGVPGPKQQESESGGCR